MRPARSRGRAPGGAALHARAPSRRPPPASTIAAYDGAAGVLVLVSYNPGGAPVDVVYDLTAFSSAAGPVTRWNTEAAAGGDKYVQTALPPPAARSFAATLGPRCVSTFEIEGVAL